MFVILLQILYIILVYLFVCYICNVLLKDKTKIVTATHAPPTNRMGSLSHQKNCQVHFPSFQVLSFCYPVVGGLWDGLFFVRGAGVMMGGVCGSGAVEECRNPDHGLKRGEGWRERQGSREGEKEREGERERYTNKQNITCIYLPCPWITKGLIAIGRLDLLGNASPDTSALSMFGDSSLPYSLYIRICHS